MLWHTKALEGFLGFAGERDVPMAPGEADGAGVERLMGQDETLPLLGRQTVFHQRKIKVFVAAVEFVPDDRMTQVGQVNADLMFPAGEGKDTEQSKRGEVRDRRLEVGGRKTEGGWSVNR